MSKADEIKERIVNTREIFKLLSYLLIATLTGSVTVAYRVMAGKDAGFVLSA